MAELGQLLPCCHIPKPSRVRIGGATVYLDSFTYQNTNNNVSDNIEGGYILLS
jgi:hypothetical protein